MSENGNGRPRRSTRYSSTAAVSSSSTPASSCSASQASTTSTPNPYKKPTYLANRSAASGSPAASEITTPISTSRGRGRGRGRPSNSRGGGANTSGSSRGRSSKPECVATRVESRRSTGGSTTGGGGGGGSASKKKRRGYNSSQDYHYGSDFESDRGDSEMEVEEAGSESDSGSVDDNILADEGAESDSDFSIISSSKLLRLPSPPVPIWLDAEKVVEELDLPKSSDDLLLPRDLVMKAVAIYEPLRRFHQLVRLSPFRFEDFCAALGSDEQSSLLAEVHIQLLKTILREEDANGTVYGPNEVKDSVQAVLYFVDNLTWPESLRSFIESDPSWGDILEEIMSVEYPFCGPEIRIKVLSWLVDMFLATNSVREGLLSEGNILHEDHCRSCNRLGELICCENCPAVYHLGCIEPPLREDEDPPDDWKCPVCIKHRLSGIIDCASELEKAGLLIRHEKLGYDRHGRKYWFLVRRILVESEDGSSVWYYSTPLQVEELLYRLDEDLHEVDLVDNIRTFKEEIMRQMEITEKITSGLNNHRKTYIDAENAFLKKIHEDREEAMLFESEEKTRLEEEAREAERQEEEKKTLVEEEIKQKEEAERKRIREERLHRRNRNKFVDYDDTIPLDSCSDLDTSGETTASHHGDDDEKQPRDNTEVKEEREEHHKTKKGIDKKDDVNIDNEIENDITKVEKNMAERKESTTETNKNETDISEAETQRIPDEELSSTLVSDEREKTDSKDAEVKITDASEDLDQVETTEEESAGIKNTVKTIEDKEKLSTLSSNSEPNSTEDKKEGDSVKVEAKIEPETEAPVVKIEATAPEVKVETATPACKTVAVIEVKGKGDELKPRNESRRKSKALLLDWDTDERMTRLKATGLFKLGQEGAFRSYVNSYSGDPLALGKTQHVEDRDRKRHMSHKFSLTFASECKWSGNQNGFRSSLVGTLRSTLMHLEGNFPTTLMHVNWPMLRKAWVSAVSACVNSKDFSKAMVALAACIRPACYNPVWSESMGHFKLMRMTAVDREERKKTEKRDKKDRDEEEDRLRVLPQFVKYTIPIKHQVYKQKGEEYRLHGRWGWIWLSTSRRCKSQDSRTLGLLGGPNKHVIQVKNEIGKVKTILIDPTVFDKLMAKRNLSQKSSTCGAASSTLAASPMKFCGNESPLSSSCSSTSTTFDSPSKIKVQEDGEKDTKDKEGLLEPTDEKPDVEVSETKGGSGAEAVETKGDSEAEAAETKGNSEAEVAETKGDSEAETEETKGDSEAEAAETKEGGLDVEAAETKEISKTSAVVVGEEAMDVEEDKEKVTDIVEKGESTLSTPAVVPEDAEIKVEVKEEYLEKEISEKVSTSDDDKNKEEIVVEKEIPSKEIVEYKDNIEDKPMISSSSTVTSGSEDIPKNAVSGVGRKFKTDLVNVSLGIVSANRILYPKIAHRIPVLDALLARRMRLQAMEEKELVDSYGVEMLEKVKKFAVVVKEEDAVKTEEVGGNGRIEEVLDESFPLAGIYRYQCYSFVCQTAAWEFNTNKSKRNNKGVRDYECKCYSPMCRLKYFVQETQRRKDEKVKEIEKEKMNKIVKEIEEKRMYTQLDLASKLYLKKLPEQVKKKRNQVKYPPTSTFRSALSKKPSILILPQHELRKLSRAGGRTFTPAEFAVNPKTGSWAWPYPCGRPFFKTGWQYKAVHAPTLAAAAMQLKVLWASIRWDDIQMKVPNSDGKNQMTTDMEVITTEILKQRIVGRFMEKVQYLRKKTIVPIDAPKTIRAKSRDSTEITPSRSGLRKRKRAESPDKTDPVVTEDWVDEDKVDLWEIKYFGEKQDKKPDPVAKSTTPATRTKSGVTLKVPEKYDPSPLVQPEKPEKPEKAEKMTVSATKTAEMMREQLETELKMQRAVHLSKRDNHPKTNNNSAKTPTPTASQQLQKQNAAAGLPANPRSYSSTGGTGGVSGGNPSGQKKIFVTKTATPAVGKVGTAASAAAEAQNPVILNRKATPGVVVKQQGAPTVTGPLTPQQQQPNQPTQKITVFRTPDGKLQVKGLLPGQTVYQTADGRICLSGTPVRTQQVQVSSQPQQQQQIMHQQQQSQSQTIVIQGTPGQLQQTGTPGIIQVQGSQNPMMITTGSAGANTGVSQVANQPLINISNPAMRTVITSSAANNANNPNNLMRQIGQQIIQNNSQQQQQPQMLHTYATPKTSRKANLKAVPASASSMITMSPASIAPAAGTISGTINAQGQIVLTSSRGGTHVLQSAQMNQQGQIVITSQPAAVNSPQLQQGTTVMTSSALSSPISAVVASQNTPIAVSSPVATSHGGAAVQIPGMPAGGKVLFHDGTKTIVVAGGGNLTSQQLQQIIQMQAKKFQTVKTSSGTVVQQIVQQSQQMVQQQPQQQPQQQTTMQFIQQPGQPMQLISSQGGSVSGGNMQAILNAAQQQGQQIVIHQGAMTAGGGHQIATIGGQQVLVKKMIKPTGIGGNKAGGNVGVVQIAAGSQAQLQQLLAQGKNVIRVDQKQSPGGQQQHGVMVATSLQQQRIQPVMGATTVTRAPGLPISIVSPSKAKMVIQQQQQLSPMISTQAGQQQLQQQQIVVSSSQQQQLMRQHITTSGVGVIQTVSSANAARQQPIATLGGSGTQVVTALPGPQVVSTISGTQFGLQQQQQIRGVISGKLFGNQQQQLQQIVVSGNQSQQGQLQFNIRPQQQSPQQQQQPQQQIMVGQQQPQQSVPVGVAATPPKSPIKGSPSKIVAHVVQTPQGPKVVLSGIKPGELTPAQMASLQSQLQKQMIDQQLAQQKAGGVTPTGPPTPIKVVLQAPVVSSPLSAASPMVATPGSPSVANTTVQATEVVASAPVAIAATPVVAGSVGIPKIAKVLTTTEGSGNGSAPPVLGVKSQPVLIQQQIKSPAKIVATPLPTPVTITPATPPVVHHHGHSHHHTTKSPPNSANIDAAIAAVASNVDAPVIVPSRASPVKKNNAISQNVKTGGGGSGGAKGKGSKSTILKDILQKPEAEIFGTKSTPNKKGGGGTKKKKAVTPGTGGVKKQKGHAATNINTGVSAVSGAELMMMPLEPESVPQPVEGDVVVCTTEEVVETTTTLPAIPEGPRFVLSQDLMQREEKEAESMVPSTTSMISSLIGDQKSPKIASTSPRQSATTITTPSPVQQQQKPVKSGSSRRKSPVKSKINFVDPQPQQPKATQVRTVSAKKGKKIPSPRPHPPTQAHSSPGQKICPMSHPKLIASLQRHKELLKKDICRKRSLLEKELCLSIQKEISEELGVGAGNIGKTKSPVTSPKTDGILDTHHVVKAGQKRKSSESKMSGGSKEPASKMKKMSTISTSAGTTPTGTAPTTPTNASTGPSPGKGSPKKKVTKSKMYCICKTPYDNSKFYVGCDICSNWYHGDCIGISEEMSQCLSEYICTACQKDEDKVYCLCKEPYDEAQFYICCDTCQDWFHGRCVGILQAEGSAIDEYVCPKCDPNSTLNHSNLRPLMDSDYPSISKLLKEIMRHKSAWPFIEPVDPLEAPKYYQVIKEPMDLQTIQFRVEQKVYAKLRDFIGDITKIFDNCRYYNPTESPFYRCAEGLEAFFAQKITLMRQLLTNRKQ